MRELIKQQLAKVNYADLSNYDETTGVFNIPKYSKPKFNIGKMYIVQVANELVNNNSSVIATNWNNGTSPRGACLKVFVSKMVGKMIYVDSLVFDLATKSDTSIIWSGWLPTEQLTQISAF
jgi:hypothetical protein